MHKTCSGPNWEKLDICPLQVDENYLIKLGLIELQREFGKKVVFKIKTRHNNPNPQDDINFMKSIVPNDLDYEIFMDVEDDNLLIFASLLFFFRNVSLKLYLGPGFLT